MDKIFSAYDFAKTNAVNGDIVDKLHSKYSVIFFLTICILVGFRQYDGKSSIVCWLPNQFSSDQVEYAHNMCWINNTYWYPSETDADLFPESLKNTIPYYQFILFILLAQSILFYLPSLFWQYMVNDSVSYISKLLDQVEKSKLAHGITSQQNPNLSYSEDTSKQVVTKTTSDKNLFPNEYNEILKKDLNAFLNVDGPNIIKSKIVDKENEENSMMNIKQKGNIFLKSSFSKGPTKTSQFMKPKRGLKNLAKSYFLLKILNISNVILQIVLLHFVFGLEFYKYGFEFMDKLLVNRESNALSTQFFPIFSFCDFFVHANMRQVHTHTVQCLLPINVGLERIYVIIWLWLVILLFITLNNLVTWAYEYLMPGRIDFLFKYISIRINIQHFKDISCNEFTRGIYKINSKTLQIPNEWSLKEISCFTRKNLRTFQRNYLGNDGFIMLHLIKTISGDMIFMEILYYIWSDFVRSIEV